MRITLHSMRLFLKGGTLLWIKDDSWTQVGVVTGKSAFRSDFSWIQKFISVIRFASCLVFAQRRGCAFGVKTVVIKAVKNLHVVCMRV